MDRETMTWRVNEKGQANVAADIPDFKVDEDMIREVVDFHSLLPGYKPTKLHNLDSLAGHLGIGRILLKDESTRFGLNAFKGLGGSYAVAKLLSGRINNAKGKFDFRGLITEALTPGNKGRFTFVTATDGNHGRGVAWAARVFGQQASVFMPKGSSKARFDAIAEEGADVSITAVNYDETVRIASAFAAQHGHILVQDQAWEGYTEVPSLIMQGYLTIMDEIFKELVDGGSDMPTHILLQAGVGSFAGSMLAYLESKVGAKMPVSVIIEPYNAAPLYESAGADDGGMRFVGGSLDTIMAGLACGEPNPIAWRVLKRSADVFVSCADEVAALGMRILGNPCGCDPRIVSGESGAAGAGLLYLALRSGNAAHQGFGKILGLGPSSRVLIISTEGDTDPDRYRQIAWEGKWPLI